MCEKFGVYFPNLLYNIIIRYNCNLKNGDIIHSCTVLYNRCNFYKLVIKQYRISFANCFKFLNLYRSIILVFVLLGFNCIFMGSVKKNYGLSYRRNCQIFCTKRFEKVETS